MNRHPVHFSSSFPRHLSGHLLSNSQCFYAEGSYGYILAQFLNAQPYGILYITGTTKEELTMEFALRGDGLVCLFVQEKSVRINSAQTGEVVLHSQSISLLSVSSWQGSLHIKAGQRYAFFSVIYPLVIVNQQLDFFPALEEFKEKLATSVFFFDLNRVCPVPVSFSNLIYSLLHTPYVPLAKSFYHHLVILFLGEILQSQEGESKPEPLFTLDDVDRIRIAKDWIDSHLDTHFPTSQIARKAGLNEYKLKKGFKALYGMGVYTYLLRQRLLIAKLALEQTRKPIKQISRQASYANENNFSVAFKRAFGITPYRYRLSCGLR